MLLIQLIFGATMLRQTQLMYVAVVVAGCIELYIDGMCATIGGRVAVWRYTGCAQH